MRGPGREHGWRVPTRGGAGARPRQWRVRGSAGAEACLCPTNIASLVEMQPKRGQPPWSLCMGRDQVHARAFSQLTSGSARKTPRKQQGRGGKRSGG